MNGLKARAPRLLKTVGGRPWATAKDHDDDDAQSSAVKQREAMPIDAEPKSSSDVEADPASSSDDDMPVSSADIPGSFDSSGKSLGNFKPPKGAFPQKRRTTKDAVVNGAGDRRPRKLQRLSDDENVDMFGEIKRKKPKARNLGSNQMRGAPELTYAKPKNELKGFVNPLASYSSSNSTSPGEFKKEFVLTPNARIKSRASSQGKEHEYDGAKDYLSDLEQPGTEAPAPNRKNRRIQMKTAVGLNKESPSSSAPEFKVVESLTQAAHKFDPADLRKEQEEEERREKEQTASIEFLSEGPCPMQCGKILPRRVLETLSTSATIKEQQRFCRKHQIKDAEAIRDQRGYPTIDWERLTKRLERHNESIAKMIDQPETLHFRKEMEERNRKGRDRTLLQHMKSEGLEGIGVGYYGPKGLDMMADHIMKNFAPDIRERAMSDKVIAGRGATGYVQMVLVLELATLLIRKDMSVDEVGARQIMSESTEIGGLLYPSDTGRARGRPSRTMLGEDD